MKSPAAEVLKHARRDPGTNERLTASDYPYGRGNVVRSRSLERVAVRPRTGRPRHCPRCRTLTRCRAGQLTCGATLRTARTEVERDDKLRKILRWMDPKLNAGGRATQSPSGPRLMRR
jgi:hypothetical protein